MSIFKIKQKSTRVQFRAPAIGIQTAQAPTKCAYKRAPARHEIAHLR
jgi:hypothetical protein